ncbi:MAG: NADH-quinone oxidoreductase subunit N [Opitutales bacterium]|nr:NADH-quinone oxidoreductase subunit N [Opitutales bacterium]
MNPADLQALLPILIVAGGALLVMLVLSFKRSQTLSSLLTLLSLAAALASIPMAMSADADRIAPLLVIDSFGFFYQGLMLILTMVVTIFAHSYLEKFRMERGEFYILLLLSLVGAIALAQASHFVSLFLGIELLSVSLYIMVGYIFTRAKAIEAAVKYLFLAAVTSAFLLFGMALIYARLGSMDFITIAHLLREHPLDDPYLLAGSVLMFVGIGFKLSVVPFHQWTPDIYQGAPAPVTGYLATVSKIAVMAVTLRFFYSMDLHQQPGIAAALTLIAAASMLVGNLLALFQDNVKRLLAYSSIAHIGYILVAFIAGGERGPEAVTFYLSIYSLALLAAFGVIAYLSPSDRDSDTIDHYRGLFWSRPWIAVAFSIALFSLIGLPLTAGFMGKLFLVSAGIQAEEWLLVIWLAANSAIGLYYYLRIVIAMYQTSDDPQSEDSTAPPFALIIGTVIGLLVLSIVWFGLHPESLNLWIRALSTQP